jgi:hypothetical protein
MWSGAGCVGTRVYRAVAKSMLSVGLIGHDTDTGGRGVKMWYHQMPIFVVEILTSLKFHYNFSHFI